MGLFFTNFVENSVFFITHVGKINNTSKLAIDPSSTSEFVVTKNIFDSAIVNNWPLRILFFKSLKSLINTGIIPRLKRFSP